MTDASRPQGKPQSTTDDRAPAAQTPGRAWSADLYAAPARARARADADARVTVTTLPRPPKVYLTAPTTVPYVDLNRFMGRWYEIARLPYFTQRRCQGEVFADYRLGEDGMVHVTNHCRHRDGAIGQARGIARVVEPASNARLQISFRMLYGVHVFWDDYWIVGLGVAYDYALVGQPTRRRGWILARAPDPPEERYRDWLHEFGKRGFLTAEFQRTRQQAMLESD